MIAEDEHEEGPLHGVQMHFEALLGNLRERYQVAAKCLPPFRFSVGSPVPLRERLDDVLGPDVRHERP
ncbi:MAG: hypothetical protein JWO48_104 [Bryobacterales bacterium]|nr:hypothetical protein [Bryobacterales bacterium]